MAVLLVGRTQCGICDQVIEDSSAAELFPAFLPKEHTLARFSDAAFHRSCLDREPSAPKVRELHRRFQEIWKTRPLNASLEALEAWGRRAFAGFADD